MRISSSASWIARAPASTAGQSAAATTRIASLSAITWSPGAISTPPIVTGSPIETHPLLHAARRREAAVEDREAERGDRAAVPDRAGDHEALELAELRVHRGEVAEVAAVGASAGVDDEDGALGSLLEQAVDGQVVARRAGTRRRRPAERGRFGDRRQALDEPGCAARRLQHLRRGIERHRNEI